MHALTNDPPRTLAGVELARVRDYQKHEVRSLPANERIGALPEPQGDLVFFESAPSDSTISFAARPSGTEPKIKFYFFARSQCPEGTVLADIKNSTENRLREFQEALSAWVQAIWADQESAATK
jgi:phosphoglucomutase/phosphomannomutase